MRRPIRSTLSTYSVEPEGCRHRRHSPLSLRERIGVEEKARRAVAASSLKCTVVGPRAFPWAQVRQLAGQLKVER